MNGERIREVILRVDVLMTLAYDARIETGIKRVVTRRTMASEAAARGVHHLRRTEGEFPVRRRRGSDDDRARSEEEIDVPRFRDQETRR
jgi:hypothetical protein